MKNIKIFSFTIIVLLGASYVSAQNADKIINKYIKAIGGKKQLTKMNSLYIEGKMNVMGMEGVMKLTTLNGKGYKQEIEINGAAITSCYTDKDGWSINPMTGSTSAVPMQENEYKTGKDQIYIGAPFIYVKEKGYQTELLGNEKVGDANAYKIKITSPDSIATVYFFDTESYLLLRSIQQTDMQGQMMDNIITFSDYKETDGYAQPYKMEINIANGQLIMTATFNKVEVNKPVEEAFFIKP